MKIKKSDLKIEINLATRRAGNPEWGVYAKPNGEVQLRGNSYNNEGWVEIMNCKEDLVREGTANASYGYKGNLKPFVELID